MAMTWRAGFLAGAILGLAVGLFTVTRWAQPAAAADAQADNAAGTR